MFESMNTFVLGSHTYESDKSVLDSLILGVVLTWKVLLVQLLLMHVHVILFLFLEFLYFLKDLLI